MWLERWILHDALVQSTQPTLYGIAGSAKHIRVIKYAYMAYRFSGSEAMEGNKYGLPPCVTLCTGSRRVGD